MSWLKCLCTTDMCKAAVQTLKWNSKGYLWRFSWSHVEYQSAKAQWLIVHSAIWRRSWWIDHKIPAVSAAIRNSSDCFQKSTINSKIAGDSEHTHDITTMLLWKKNSDIPVVSLRANDRVLANNTCMCPCLCVASNWTDALSCPRRSHHRRHAAQKTLGS